MSNEQSVLTRAQAEELISFLLSSAEITLREPIHYGPVRLIDAASRLIGFMEINGAVDESEFLAELKDEIDVKKQWCMWDKPGFYGFLREAPHAMADYVMSEQETAE